MKMGIRRGRQGKPNLKISVCGEHGGDPQSIGFFHQEGINVVSCSPFRVPVARLAAAQAVEGCAAEYLAALASQLEKGPEPGRGSVGA